MTQHQLLLSAAGPATSFFPFSFPVPAAQQGDQLSAFSYRKANTMPLILVFIIGLFIGANFGLLMFGLLQTADHKD